MTHIIEIVVWKLVLIGLGVASGSFIIGFVIACVLAASGRASRMEEEIEGKLLKIPRPHEWPGPPREAPDVSDINAICNELAKRFREGTIRISKSFIDDY